MKKHTYGCGMGNGTGSCDCGKEVLELLEIELPRYDIYPDGDCGCLGFGLDIEEEKDGDWVKFDELSPILRELALFKALALKRQLGN